MTTIYLIRHAEAEGNLYRRVHGWYNSRITENGYRQIAALEERFRTISIDAVYASDLFRTMTTARGVYVPKGLELRTDPGLREMNLGDWEDLTFGEVRHHWPEEMERFNRSDPAWKAPNGEDFHQMGDRIEGTVRRIAQMHPNQTIALFSHGMVIRQLIARVKEVPQEEWHSVPHGDNTAVTRLTFDGERFGLELVLDNSHLPQAISTLARQSWWRKDKRKTVDVNLWFRPAVPEEREWYPAGENRNLTVAMAGDRPAGILAASRAGVDGAGQIEYLTIFPEHRGRNLGVQLIGQAVSVFRKSGLDRIVLACPAEEARGYFRQFGFTETGEGLGRMEKYIGLDQ